MTRYPGKDRGLRGDQRQRWGAQQTPRAAPVKVERRPPPRPREPMPIGDRCNPLCPLFRCAKHALTPRRIGQEFVAWCNWVNDKCIGHTCQYASCIAGYLLPDGRCVHALKGKSTAKKGPSFEEELEQELMKGKVKSLLARRGIGKDLESELL